MRWLPIAIVLLGALPVAAKSSNPAFLGVGMNDLGGGANIGPCQIQSVTKDSGAEAAGLRFGDVFVTVDGKAVANCGELIQQIQTRESCETVKIEVRRGGGATTVTAQLCSRADVMRQRVVGQPLPLGANSLVRVDDQKASNLAARGRTTIVGWFDQRSCVGCDQVFGTVDRWSRGKSTKGSTISVFGATFGSPAKSVPQNVQDLKAYQSKLDVPLLVSDEETFKDFAITDSDRIHFMVIDCRGIVQYAVPLAPDADDQRAVLDEIYAAAEQAARKR